MVECVGCKRLKPGDEVWTLVEGAYAEYVTVPETFIGLKPVSMNHTESGTLPEVGLTSLLSLHRTGSPGGIPTPMPVGTPWPGRRNLTVVITAGSGGTGSVGIELARAFGVRSF